MNSLSKLTLCVAAACSAMLALPSSAQAQSNVSERAQQAQPAELQQLAAPIALYPDALLSQILMASTYPIEVVEAARWRQTHPGLEGDALESALLSQDWDPSVKSLMAFPDVLDMMNERISWTTRLGDIFLSQQDALMEQVQALRARAQAAGNLTSGPQQTVTLAPTPTGATIIRIEPSRPEVVYVPVYNPVLVYGPWPYPAYPPFYWYPPAYAAANATFTFGVGLFIGHALWGGYDWHARHLRVANLAYYNRFNRTHLSHTHWQHNPYHRRNVAYGDPRRARQFYGDRATHFAARESYRMHADTLRRELPHMDRTTVRTHVPAHGERPGRQQSPHTAPQPGREAGPGQSVEGGRRVGGRPEGRPSSLSTADPVRGGYDAIATQNPRREERRMQADGRRAQGAGSSARPAGMGHHGGRAGDRPGG